MWRSRVHPFLITKSPTSCETRTLRLGLIFSRTQNFVFYSSLRWTELLGKPLTRWLFCLVIKAHPNWMCLMAVNRQWGQSCAGSEPSELWAPWLGRMVWVLLRGGKVGGLRKGSKRRQKESKKKNLVIWEMLLFNLGQIKVESVWCGGGSWWLDMPLLMQLLFSFLSLHIDTLKETILFLNLG